MSPLEFFNSLDRAFQTFVHSVKADGGGLVCIVIDHWQELRQQIGLQNLFRLRHQVQALVSQQLFSGEKPAACAINESTILARLSSSRSDEVSLKERVEELFNLLVRREFNVADETRVITVSLAWCSYDHRFIESEQMLLRLVDATEALSEQGGNEIIEVQPLLSSMQASSEKRKLLALLMASLRNQTVQVVFQPLLATSGESDRIFQMLPRLKTDSGRLIPAARFVPLAREAGLLGSLDRWMLNKALATVESLPDAPELKLFISQSDELLRSEEGRQWLEGRLRSHPQAARQLVMEFGIPLVMAHLDSAVRLFSALDAHGVAVCLSMIDEHSNRHLISARIKVPYLRMSPGFMHRLRDEPAFHDEAAEVVSGLRNQGFKVIMPQIEDVSVASKLWQFGVDFMQGRLIHDVAESLDVMLTE